MIELDELYFTKNLEEKLENKRINYGVVDSSSYNLENGLERFILREKSGDIAGILKFKDDYAIITRFLDGYYKVIEIWPNKLEINIVPPKIPKKKVKEGFGNEKYKEQNPIQLEIEGDYKSHLTKIKNIVSKAKNKKSKSVYLKIPTFNIFYI